MKLYNAIKNACNTTTGEFICLGFCPGCVPSLSERMVNLAEYDITSIEVKKSKDRQIKKDGNNMSKKFIEELMLVLGLLNIIYAFVFSYYIGTILNLFMGFVLIWDYFMPITIITLIKKQLEF